MEVEDKMEGMEVKRRVSQVKTERSPGSKAEKEGLAESKESEEAEDISGAQVEA